MASAGRINVQVQRFSIIHSAKFSRAFAVQSVASSSLLRRRRLGRKSAEKFVLFFFNNMDPKVIEALKVIRCACPSLLVSNSEPLYVSSDCFSPAPAAKLPSRTTGRHGQNSHQPSAVSSSDEDELANNSTPFSVQALLEKKRKNSKSTPAQDYFLFSIREASKDMGWWDNPPGGMNTIAPIKMQQFYAKVLSTLPQLAMHTKDIKKRLSASLINRRNQLKNVLNWKRSKQYKKYRKQLLEKSASNNNNINSDNKNNNNMDILHDNTPSSNVDSSHDDEESEYSKHDDEESDDDGFHFLSGDDVKVMQGDVYLAKARYMYLCTKDDDYAAVCLKVGRIPEKHKSVTLTGPKNKNGKKSLQEVKVGEEFYWPKNQLIRFPAPRQSVNKYPLGKRQVPAVIKQKCIDDKVEKKKKKRKRTEEVEAKVKSPKKKRKQKEQTGTKEIPQEEKRKEKEKVETEEIPQEEKRKEKEKVETKEIPQEEKRKEKENVETKRCRWKGYALVTDIADKDIFSETVVDGKRARKQKNLTDFETES